MSNTVTRHDRDQLADSASMAKEAVTDLAAETGRYANQRIQDAKKSANQVMKSVKEKAGEYHETIVDYVRENPYKALAIAAGVGLTAGFLLLRRRS